MTAEEKIKEIIDMLRPFLATEGGNIEFVDFNDENGVLKVKLLGACHGCPMAGVTLKNVVEEILKEFREPLTNFIYGIIEDHQEAEDIAIDVFAYLAAKRGYNFKVSLKTYLFMLGKSRAFDFLRRRKIRSAVELSEVEDYIPSEFSLEEDLLEKERQIMVHRAVSSLSPKMRTAVILIYFENMSYEDAAKVMKLSKKQVDNLLYRAKVRLKTIIGKENV